MAQHLALFEAAGVQPEQVTIDLFALYGLYRMIPAYAQQKGGIVLLEIEAQSTRMAYIYDGQLRFIRTLSKGLLGSSTPCKRNNCTSLSKKHLSISFGMAWSLRIMKDTLEQSSKHSLPLLMM